MSAISSLANIVYIIRLVNVILKEKVDLVHVNNGLSNLEPVIAALLLNRKFVVHFHGIETPGLVQRILLNKVGRFIVISEFLRSALVENGFPKERMIVVPNPVQKTHALSKGLENLRRQYGLNKNDKVFAIVGRIVRWKGHIEFLNAAFIVLESVPDTKALIVGDFSDGDESYQKIIQAIINDSGYCDRIIMTGYIKDVSSIYSIMDLCLHTSIEPEPFGLVIIEAMANGVPVIASDRGAPKEIITDGVNGYIVNPGSSRMIADVAIRLLDDDELRIKIGESGRQHVLQHYNEKDYAHSVESIYAQVLDEVV
jgi:glycosyltransferase involved in cell wall biosynthesis